MSSNPVSPQSEALAARQEANQQQQNIATAWNTAQKAIYAERVYELYTWPKYFENGPNVPQPMIPAPPQGYVLQTQPMTPYDTALNLPARVLAILQDGVIPLYVDPGTAVTPTPKPGTVLDIGAAGRNGEWYAMPDDNMPVGSIVQAPDGSWVKKVASVTPFGTVYFYAPAQ